MPYKDKDAQRDYQKKWMAQRRAEFFESKHCATCGSTDSLELDHVDPAYKVAHRIWSWSEPRRLEELSKCQVLCSSCHMEKTKEQFRKPICVNGHVKDITGREPKTGKCSECRREKDRRRGPG